jgi:8-oxo-dGTP diphosphatase
MFSKLVDAFRRWRNEGETTTWMKFKLELEGRRPPQGDQDAVTEGAAEPVVYPDVVVGIVLRRRRAAMLQKTNQAGTMWKFPGGSVEAGETNEEAVVRELRRDLGLNCRVVRKIGERRHPVTGGCICYYLCKAQGGKSRYLERYKAEEIRWLTPREINHVTNGTLFDQVWETIRDEAKLSR